MKKFIIFSILLLSVIPLMSQLPILPAIGGLFSGASGGLGAGALSGLMGAMGPIGWAALAASIIGQGFSSIKNAKANKKTEQYARKRDFELKDLFNKEYNTNYLDTDEAKASIRTSLDQMKEMDENSKSSGAITGSTAEKNVATKDMMGKNFSGLVTNLSGQGTRRKEGIMSQYLNAKGNNDMFNLNVLNNKAAQWNQLGQNAQQLSSAALLSSMFPNT